MELAVRGHLKTRCPSEDGDNNDEPFDRETSDAVLTTAISIREEVHQNASENIQSAQKQQQRDYNRRHQVPNTISWPISARNVYPFKYLKFA